MSGTDFLLPVAHKRPAHFDLVRRNVHLVQGKIVFPPLRKEQAISPFFATSSWVFVRKRGHSSVRNLKGSFTLLTGSHCRSVEIVAAIETQRPQRLLVRQSHAVPAQFAGHIRHLHDVDPAGARLKYCPLFLRPHEVSG